MIESYRGEDSESLLSRMVSHGLLAKVRADVEVGTPNVYRLTAKTLHLVGFPNIEVLRAAILERVGALTVELDGEELVASVDAPRQDQLAPSSAH